MAASHPEPQPPVDDHVTMDGWTGRPSFTGIVLTGGTSTRMGTDKALIEIDGRPLAAHTLGVLIGAGASECLAVGGDHAALTRLGYTAVADRYPGDGPLGGVITGLLAAGHELTVVLACDQPALSVALVSTLVGDLASHPSAAAVIPVVDGRRQVLTAGYRRSALADATVAFEAGERSLQRVVDRLVIHERIGLEPGSFVDLDVPDDVRRYALTRSAHPPDAPPSDPDQR